MVMGAPTEIYLYGTLYWLVCVSVVLVAVATNYIYLPVFYELQLTSTYEVGNISNNTLNDSYFKQECSLIYIYRRNCK
jgi:sodium-coupled monocarboxylate transporter 8/12